MVKAWWVLGWANVVLGLGNIVAPCVWTPDHELWCGVAIGIMGVASGALALAGSRFLKTIELYKRGEIRPC